MKFIGNNAFQLIAIDITSGALINVTEPCIATACPLASSEAIAEWPGDQLKSGITLTKYRAFPFYDYYATDYTSAGSYYAFFSPTTAWSTHFIQTIGPRKQRRDGTFRPGFRVVQKPSRLQPGGRAFYEYWRHAY